MVIDGKEQLAGTMKLSAFRAPTDNDRKMKLLWGHYNIWQGENIDCAFTKVYDCHVEDGVVVVQGSLAGVSRCPLVKYGLFVRIYKDGTRYCLH